MSNWPFNNEEPVSESQLDENSQSDGKKVIPFAVRACDFCKKRKIRCEGTIPCTACQRRGQVCTFTREQSKRGPKPKRARRDVSAASGRGSEEVGGEMISLQPLNQDLSKLKIELEIQKRLEAHWKQQYFDLLQQQQSTQLVLGSSNVPAYLRNIFVDNNTTGLALDVAPDSPLIGQFSSASWGLIRDPDFPFKLQSLFAEANMCSLPSYKLMLPIDEPVNILLWKVLMHNMPDSIAEFLRHETTPLVLQFMQSAVVFAQGLRGFDEEQQHLDLGNHLLLVINCAFNILFYQREVQYNIKYVKQIAYELLNLAQFLKYTGTGAASKQLSPLLMQILQQFEPALDDPDLLTNAYGHMLHKAESISERDYWMAKLNGVQVQNPLSKAMRDFTVVISGLKIVPSQSQSKEELDDFLQRIDAAQEVLTSAAETDPKNRDNYKFFAIWAHMSRAEVFHRLNEPQQHDLALKETMRRYFALPRNMFRKALRSLATLVTAEGINLVTANKLLQLTDSTFDPSGMPRDMALIIQPTSSIVEIHSSSDEINSDVVSMSPHDSHESNETFDDFIFDPIVEQMTEAM